MGEACSKCGERRSAYWVLVVKPEGKGPFGRPVNIYKKVSQSHYRPEVPRGFQEVKVPRLSYNGPGWL